MMAASFFSKLFKKRAAELAFSEGRFRALIENGMEVITLVDDHFMPIYRSPASIRLTGWTTEERKKTGIIDFTHPEDLPAFRQILDQVLLNPGKPFKVSFRTLHKEGHYAWFAGTVTNLLHNKHIRAIVSNLHDITESKAAEEQLHLLASHLQDVREEERTNMAREIHDELGQLLTGLKMDVSWLYKRADPHDEAVREKFKGLLSLLDTTVGTVRRLASELRPAILDDLGLSEALQWHSVEFGERFGLPSTVDIRGYRPNLPPGVATGLFRIYQEALTNVARHAKATRVSAELDMGADRVDLIISDDGKGFEVDKIGAKKTLGLLGMKERALMMGGKCECSSVPGSGTTINVSVPLAP
jgi:PAS domain S-box-containing protein